MDSDIPLVSVIIPTYNREVLIGETLDCLLHQSYRNWECIIIDDGSTDNTERVVQNYLKDNRFSYYQKPNEGAAIAKNFGIKKSMGKYVLPLDSDDIIHKSYMIKAVQFLEENENFKLVYCEAMLFGSENKKWPIPQFDFKLLLIYNMIFNSALFRRKDFDSVKGYEKYSLLEDWDLWIKLLKNGGKVYQIPEPLFFYRSHKQGSISNELRRKDTKFRKNMDLLYKRHIEEYLYIIGNPIELERERRKLASIVKSADYNVAVKIMKHPLFKFCRNIKNNFKRRLREK